MLSGVEAYHVFLEPSTPLGLTLFGLTLSDLYISGRRFRKNPHPSRFCDAGEIDLCEHDFFALSSPREHCAKIVTHKRSPEERECIFRSHAVHRSHRDGVCDRMAALHSFPCCLPIPFLRILIGKVSDGGGVHNDLRTFERRDPRCLGEPLVVADERGNAAERSFENSDACIPRSKVLLLMVTGIFGNMRLAVGSKEGAVGAKHSGGVVELSIGSFFKQRTPHKHNAAPLSRLRKESGGFAPT